MRSSGRAALVHVALASAAAAAFALAVPSARADIRASDPDQAAAGLLDAAPHKVGFALDSPDHPQLDLLRSFRDASVERLGPIRLYTTGRYGKWVKAPWLTLSWVNTGSVGADEAPPSPNDAEPDQIVGASLPSLAVGADPSLSIDSDVSWLRFYAKLSRHVDPFNAPVFASTGSSLFTDGFAAVFELPPQKAPVDWRCRRRPVLFMRYGAENDRFELVRCDGSTAIGALDRLSILARPPGVDRPSSELLPDDADPEAWSARGEWVNGVRVVHPRLLWAMQKIADAFPWKAIYIYSGYRPNAEVHEEGALHHASLHASGRALDISVYGVRKEDLFKACRELADVGCGYYPNLPFVHVDVRRAQTGKAFWIDSSHSGEPAHYVDAWPGVVESGALSWVPKRATTEPKPAP